MEIEVNVAVYKCLLKLEASIFHCILLCSSIDLQQVERPCKCLCDNT